MGKGETSGLKIGDMAEGMRVSVLGCAAFE